MKQTLVSAQLPKLYPDTGVVPSFYGHVPIHQEFAVCFGILRSSWIWVWSGQHAPVAGLLLPWWVTGQELEILFQRHVYLPTPPVEYSILVGANHVAMKVPEWHDLDSIAACALLDHRFGSINDLRCHLYVDRVEGESSWLHPEGWDASILSSAPVPGEWCGVISAQSAPPVAVIVALREELQEMLSSRSSTDGR